MKTRRLALLFATSALCLLVTGWWFPQVWHNDTVPIANGFMSSSSQGKAAGFKGQHSKMPLRTGSIQKITGRVFIRTEAGQGWQALTQGSLRQNETSKRADTEDDAERKSAVNQFLSLTKQTEIPTGSQIQTLANSRAVIELLSGDRLEIAAQSLVAVDLWNASIQSSPVVVQVLTGQIRPISLGQKGLAYVVEKGQLKLPESSGLNRFRSIQSQKRSPASPMKKALASRDPSSKHSQRLYEPEPRPERMADIPVPEQGRFQEELLSQSSGNPLSLRFIDTIVRGNQIHFERCQINALRTGTPTKGNLLLGLTFSPKGRIKNVQLIESTLANESLQQCALSVLERTQFQPYDGEEIQHTLPLMFE